VKLDEISAAHALAYIERGIKLERLARGAVEEIEVPDRGAVSPQQLIRELYAIRKSLGRARGSERNSCA
jgi:hypothetical protein